MIASPTPVSPAIGSPVLMPAAPPPAGSVEFPLSWLYENAAPSIQYRATLEVARLQVPDGAPLHGLPFAHRPALSLALAQSADGTWGDAMFAAPQAAEGFRGVGTIAAVRRLLEHGWPKQAPAIDRARRILFRLLAEDDDPSLAFELVPKKQRGDAALVHRARLTLREAAAATLAQAGFEADPRLRGAARRIVDRLDAFLTSPLAQQPFVKTGRAQVLAPEANPPSLYSLVLLAHMPLFRHECYEMMSRLGEYLAQPRPRTAPAYLIGDEPLAQPHLLLGDPLSGPGSEADDIPWVLTWLELMARLNFLRRGEKWEKLFHRLMDDRDAEGVWRPRKMTTAPKNASSYHDFVWPSFPLESPATGEKRWTDVTFRLGLIARLTGRGVHCL